jgi:quinoprotein glucose dehydrogenase
MFRRAWQFHLRKASHNGLISGGLVVGLMLLAAAISGQPAPYLYTTAKGEWPSYHGDVRGSHYSPLDQIDASNFRSLEMAWRFKTDNLGSRPEYKLEGTPLMVNGVLYATAGTRRSVIALDAATGELLWVHGEREGKRGVNAPRQLSGRGLAYWTDGKEERILYYTPGYRLIALDAKTGVRIPTFGKDGAVDLKLEMDQSIDLETGEVGIQSAPVIARDTVLVGAAFREGMTPKTHKNNKGYIRGYDVRTGKRLWIFHTIPLPGEFGNDTWLNKSWSENGNTGVWNQITADEELGLAYLPVETPSGDFYGGYRPGTNLFGESLVCVDLKTGQRKWHFQLVHHPLWNFDVSAAPILADVVVNGKPIKAVALPSKQGWLYVFDRVTGQPVWPIEERPVAKGDVPGEWYSPTQPFPTRPAAYARNGLSTDDLIDFTPELRAEALKVIAKYKYGPIFTPPVVSRVEGPLATIGMGPSSGGTNWPGGSYDPETHTAYIYACNSCVSSIGLVPPPSAEISDMKYVAGTAGQEFRIRMGPGENAGADVPPAGAGRGGTGRGGGTGRAGAAGRGATAGESQPGTPASPAPAAPPTGGGGLSVQGLPLVKPPYGTISAINLDRGEIVWQVPHGDTPDAIRNHPALKGLNVPKTGQSGYNVGTLVTKTLVIAGDGQVTTTPDHPRGAMLRAYDKKTGEEVGAVWMPAPQSGSPMTYRLNDTQFIVVAISGGPYSGEYVAFSLPAEARRTTSDGNDKGK